MSAELGVHHWNSAFLTAAFTVFVPQQTKSHTAFCQFFVNMLIIRLFSCRLKNSFTKQDFAQRFVAESFIQRPRDTCIRRSAKNPRHSITRALATLRNTSLTDSQTFEPENLPILGHLHDLL
jgi:hypothetical protein